MFKKYLHVEKYGNDAVQGIEFGTCYIFPKLDGTNACVWFDERPRAGSRTRELDTRNIGNRDNAGFAEWLYSPEGEPVRKFVEKYPQLRLYGEWLVPHTLKTYEEKAWKHFWIFDVFSDTENRYLPYDDYIKLLNDNGITDVIPCMAVINNAGYDQLLTNLKNATFLIKDGQGTGEGIVIKNYSFVNRFNEYEVAKLVTNEFKAENHKAFGAPVIGGLLIEEKIVSEKLTTAMVDKVYAKICNEKEGWNSKYIPRLFETVYYDFINEELWDILKKYNNPMVNFKTLKGLIIQQVKAIRPELF